MAKKKRISDRKDIRVIVKTPVELLPACRGFYQVEEDVLYAPVFPSGQFYSYLDSSRILLDVDRMGRLVFIQVLAPRRNWRVQKGLTMPAETIDADIRFRDFRGQLPRGSLFTDAERSLLYIRFLSARNPKHYRVANHLVFDLALHDTLAGIWIPAIADDRAARGMASWRKSAKKQRDVRNQGSRFGRHEIKPRSNRG